MSDWAGAGAAVSLRAARVKAWCLSKACLGHLPAALPRAYSPHYASPLNMSFPLASPSLTSELAKFTPSFTDPRAWHCSKCTARNVFFLNPLKVRVLPELGDIMVLVRVGDSDSHFESVPRSGSLGNLWTGEQAGQDEDIPGFSVPLKYRPLLLRTRGWQAHVV